jgi:hypothetical protein
LPTVRYTTTVEVVKPAPRDLLVALEKIHLKGMKLGLALDNLKRQR